jgi:magnesium transporter
MCQPREPPRRSEEQAMSESDFETPETAAPELAPFAADHRLDEDDRLKPEFVREVMDRVQAGDAEGARALVEPLHPADIADLFELVDRDERPALAAALADLLDADVLAEMNEWVREEFLDTLEPHEVADIAGQLETDDAVAMIEEMDEDDQRAVLSALEPEDRAVIEEALAFPEESAGRLMQRDLIAVPEHWTVGQVIDYLRSNDDLTTDFWEIFVVDAQHHPVGTCMLSWVLRSPRNISIVDVMKREQTLIPVDMDQEEVALRFQKYALISAAVVDQSGRLVGMITVDDIVQINQEEASEDILRLSGAGDGDINEPIIGTIRQRLTWLFINLGTAIIAAAVVGLFQGTISRLVQLAVLMPIVSGMGGNAGTQTMAVAVRALALNELTSSNTRRMIFRELTIAVANGLSLGALLGVSVALFYDYPDLGLVIALAMVINNLVAGLFGIAVPVVLDKVGVDPAVSSAVFVTMMTDVMGFFSFLGLATVWGLSS